MEHVMTGERPAASESSLRPRGNKVRLFFLWTAVLAPLAWGVYEALHDVKAIFD